MQGNSIVSVAPPLLRPCSKCGLNKSLCEFYKKSSSSGAVMAQCKECTKAASIKNRLKNLDSARAYDRQRNALPHRIAALNEIDRKRRGEPSRIATTKASRLKEQAAHPEKFRARDAVNNAVKEGRLVPWPKCAMPDCECKAQAHHPDYGAPLDVVWLCASHHREAHKMGKKLNRKPLQAKE